MSKGFDELLDGIVKALHWDEIIANSTTDVLEEKENASNDDIEDQGNLFKGIENKTYRRKGISTYVLVKCVSLAPILYPQMTTRFSLYFNCCVFLLSRVVFSTLC